MNQAKNFLMVVTAALILFGCSIEDPSEQRCPADSVLVRVDGEWTCLLATLLLDGGVRVIDGGVIVRDGGVRTTDGGVRRRDATLLVFNDGGTEFIDGGEREIDGGTEFIDGGVQFNDGGVLLIDGGVRDWDGGVQLIDGGVEFIDGGAEFVDGGITYQDGGLILPCNPTYDFSQNEVRVTNAVNGQVVPRIAWSGTEFGVTWQDGGGDVFFQRISALGALLGAPLNVSADPGTSRAPTIVWLGSEWGVLWETYSPGAGGINFARVSATGAITQSPVMFTQAAASDATQTTAAFDGTTIGVVWVDSRGLTAPSSDLFFARITTTGISLTGDVALFTATSTAERGRPWLTWDPGNVRFDLSWQDVNGPSTSVEFGSLNGSGTFVSSPRVIHASNTVTVARPAHARFGGGYGMTWLAGLPATSGDVVLGELDRAGSLVSSRLIRGGQTESGGRRVIAAGALRAGLAWHAGDNGSDQIFFAEVAPGGLIVNGPGRITNSTGSSSAPSIVRANGEYGLVWHDARNMNDDIYFARGVGICP